jgi:uncharacterized protein YaiL (DUF2058 family)
MEEISEEQQAAMALKLMDNVKQLIIDTVVEDYNANGPIRQFVDGGVINRLCETNQGSPLHTAVRQIVSSQMAKY